jgi:hypothetical protein
MGFQPPTLARTRDRIKLARPGTVTDNELFLAAYSSRQMVWENPHLMMLSSAG